MDILIDLLVVSLADWLIDWCIACLLDRSIDWLIDWLIDWVMIDQSIDILIYIDILIDLLVVWLADWLVIDWLINWCIACLIDWLIDLFIYLLHDWLIDWLMYCLLAWSIDRLIMKIAVFVDNSCNKLKGQSPLHSSALHCTDSAACCRCKQFVLLYAEFPVFPLPDGNWNLWEMFTCFAYWWVLCCMCRVLHFSSLIHWIFKNQWSAVALSPFVGKCTLMFIIYVIYVIRVPTDVLVARKWRVIWVCI